MAAFTSAGSLWDTNTGNHTVTATPVLADLIVVIVGGTGVAVSNVSDNNTDGRGTYSKVVADWTGFSTTGLGTMWIRHHLVGSASSTVFTATGGASTGGGLQVCRVSGMSIAGLGAVRGCGGQSTGTAGTTPAPILLRRLGAIFPAGGTQAALTANLCIGAVWGGSATPAITQPASWTESVDLSYLTPTTGMETAFRNSGETGSTITWGSTIATAFASMVIELDISVPLLGYVNAASASGHPGQVPSQGARNTIQQGAVGRNATW
jgi:hypothetical protein